jgi:hypothetical protein
MKITLTTAQAAQQLSEDKYGAWSFYGAYALINHMEELEAELGEELELDVIALRCEYSEYKNAMEAAKLYTDSVDNEADALIYLQENTEVIEVSEGGLIIRDF